MKIRSIDDINKKIENGTAKIMTAQELCQLASSGTKISFEDVDVVTTATKGLMSGTLCVLSFRVAKAREFSKAKSVFMNDIECFVGPCPNEYLGIVDVIVYGGKHSIVNPHYGGGHLFRDIVEKKPINIKVETIEGNIIEKTITIDDIYFAEMMGVRHAFKNYNAFLNPNDVVVNKSIFTVLPMKPNDLSISFCGCGSVNPLENDPNMEVIGIGTPILMNGSLGYVIGSGTRSSTNRPNLMTKAPLFEMDPKYMGGFMTSNGPEVICSIAIAIPIINEHVFNNLKMLDSNVKLNVCDIVGRNVLEVQDYGQVWKDNNYEVNVIPFYQKKYCSKCEHSHSCPVEYLCPTKAFTIKSGIDESRCFNCGTCIQVCSEHAFIGDLGEVEFKGKKIPVKLRQSDRNGAIMLMDELKEKILRREFPIKLPIAKPKIYTEKIENLRESGKN
ncbi:MAG: methanogenesis marker 16 metalloprotein [Promethearchaeota archaeon]